LFVSDLFISYSRQDQGFVRRLHDTLTAHQHNVFVDWAGIPASAEWMKEIQDAVTGSDAILFVLSPDFVFERSLLGPEKRRADEALSQSPSN
jgi:TIR domain